MTEATCLFLLDGDRILLAMKKRGFGEGKWNGAGGKVNADETIKEATTRECFEEIGVTPKDIGKWAVLNFYFPDGKPDWRVNVFVTRQWEGEPIESEEMKPEWFPVSEIPYDEMWEDDIHWLPHVLDQKKLIGHFVFDEDERLVADSVKIDFVESLK